MKLCLLERIWKWKERKQTFLPLCRLVLNLLLSYDTYFYSLIYRSLVACIRSDVSVELDIFNLPADIQFVYYLVFN